MTSIVNEVNKSNLRCGRPTASRLIWPSSPTTTQKWRIPIRTWYGNALKRPSRPSGAWSPTPRCSESTTTAACRSSTLTTSCTWNCECCSQRYVQGHAHDTVVTRWSHSLSLSLVVFVAQLYELDGSSHDRVWTMKTYQEVTRQFKDQHPDFFGTRLIFSVHRCIWLVLHSYIAIGWSST